MAWTAGITNVKIRNITTFEATGVDLTGDDFEKGLMVEIAEGEIFSAASGNDTELSEKFTLKGVYVPESKAESDAMEALHGTLLTDWVITFDSAETFSFSGIIMVYKEVIAGKLTKLQISIELTKADADKILTYA